MGLFGSPQEQVDFDDLKTRVARLEAAVASLQAQLAPARAGGLPADGAWLAEVRALKERGKLINAIKLYREQTGVGLKEAKDAVEGMA